MEIRNSTVLITGGTSGIGLEFAQQLLAQNATVLVTGRDRSKLEAAKKQFPKLYTFQCDIEKPNDIKQLFGDVTQQFPNLDILVNNAGIMNNIDLLNNDFGLENITREVDINLSGTIRMVQQFLPFLSQKKSAAIINISSGLGFIPVAIAPIYCATKAAIHSYTQTLRLQLKNTNVKVFEVAPPKTDKPMQKALPNEKGGKMMKIDKLVTISLHAIQKDRFEIKPGLSKVMKWMSRIGPGFFMNLIDRNNKKIRNRHA